MLTLWELLVTEGLQLIVVIFNYSVLLKMLMRTAMCGPIKLRSTSDSDTTCRWTTVNLLSHKLVQWALTVEWVKNQVSHFIHQICLQLHDLFKSKKNIWVVALDHGRPSHYLLYTPSFRLLNPGPPLTPAPSWPCPTNTDIGVNNESSDPFHPPHLPSA
jgi:hypothetical protein